MKQENIVFNEMKSGTKRQILLDLIHLESRGKKNNRGVMKTKCLGERGGRKGG